MTSGRSNSDLKEPEDLNEILGPLNSAIVVTLAATHIKSESQFIIRRIFVV